MPDTLAAQLTHRLFQRLRRVQAGARQAAAAVPAGPVILPVARVPAPQPDELANRLSALTTGNVAPARRATPLRVPGARCRVDPADGQRTLISGRMNEVCDALDRLIAHQAIPPAPVGFAPTRV